MRPLFALLLGICCLDPAQRISAFQIAPLTRSFGSIRLDVADGATRSRRSVRNPTLCAHQRCDENLYQRTDKSGKGSSSLLSCLRRASTVALAAIVVTLSCAQGSASIAWADESPATAQSTLLQPTNKQTAQTVVEEVWNLIQKYYIDRNFNGQVRMKEIVLWNFVA